MSENVITDINKKEEEEKNRNINRICLLQYENLRTCFRKNLIYPILGENYYNMGADVYTTDEFTTEDLLSKFNNLETTRILYSTLFRISFTLNIILIIWIIFY